MVEGKKANSSRFKLNTLLNIIKAVSNNSSIDELLKTYSSVLLDEFNINSVLIFNYDNRHWNIILRHGIDARKKPLLYDVYTVDVSLDAETEMRIV